jgi:hypothetical protein
MSLATIQHQTFLQQQALEVLQKMSLIRSRVLSELQYQESLLDTLVMIWQRKFICNSYIDGKCCETGATCDKIHLIMSHNALKEELRQAQKYKNMLASPQFWIIWMDAHQANFRCLNLLKNIVIHTGKYLWETSNDECGPVYPSWAFANS